MVMTAETWPSRVQTVNSPGSFFHCAPPEWDETCPWESRGAGTLSSDGVGGALPMALLSEFRPHSPWPSALPMCGLLDSQSYMAGDLRDECVGISRASPGSGFWCLGHFSWGEFVILHA